MTKRDTAYYEEVRRAVGHGAPTALLGTSTKSLERSLAKLKAVQQAEEAHSSRDVPEMPASSSELNIREVGSDKTIARQPGAGRLFTRMREELTAGRDRRAVKRNVVPDTRGEPTRMALLPGSDPLGEDFGYRGPTACKAAGITYRQLDYWARTGLIEPSVRTARKTGSQRLYSFRDILLLSLVRRLLDTGISIQQIRIAVQHLRDRSAEDLAQVTLMSDGKSIYEAVSPDEVVGLLADGRGVFGIALGRLWQEVAGKLAEVPAVRAKDGLIARTDDQLAAWPRRREANAEPTD
jgi:DNA-binding transcriptional MerR regulator